MRKKAIWISILLSIGIIGCFIGNYLISQMKYARMYITFGQFRTPCVNIEIEGKTYFVGINISNTSELILNKAVLADLQKKPHSELSFIDIEGAVVKHQSYLIPKMKMGDLSFDNVVVTEDDRLLDTGQEVGCIGFSLLKKMNLLIDVPNSTLIACNSKARLKKAGYILDKMFQIPFEINPIGIISIPVTTDFGILPFNISTSTTFCLINSSILKDKQMVESEEGPYCMSSVFKLNGKNFEPPHFYPENIDSSIVELEGIIGVDFLRNYPVYFDFEKKVIYIENIDF